MRSAPSAAGAEARASNPAAIRRTPIRRPRPTCTIMPAFLAPTIASGPTVPRAGCSETQRCRSRPSEGRGSRFVSRYDLTRIRETVLVRPPVTLALDVFARSLAEIGRADDDDLETVRPGLIAPPCTGGDAHHIPLLELDDLVV